MLTTFSVPDETVAPWPPSVEAVKRVAGRYRLETLLGRGGSGTVWLALDERTGEEVALKLLDVRGASHIRAIRREVTALRWLRLPGVVRLRDDGLEDGRYFIAMDAVAGLPFPGSPGAMTWEDLRPPMTRLTEALSRVHLAGVVHLDLKPANALVEASGRVVLLDFGLALGERLTREERPGFAGTPRYAAPEQCRREPCGPAADLYALGVMAFEALTGATPHAEADWRALIRRRAMDPTPSIGPLLPDLPPEIARLIDALLAVDPVDRPQSAEAVLEVLGVRTSPPAVPERPTPAALRRLFEGPDLFLLRDVDAARLLRWRAGPDPAAIADELHAWIRADLARPGPNGRWVVERVALSQLERGLRLDVRRADPPLNDLPRDVLAWTRLAWPHARPALLARLLGQPSEQIEAALTTLRAQGLVWALPGGRVGAAASGDPGPGWSPAARRAAHRRLARALRAPDARLHHLISSSAAPGEVLDALSRASPGTGPDTVARLELGVQLARAEDDGERERALLRRWTIHALSEEALPANERALLALADTPGLEVCHTLLAAGCAALRGESGRALTELDALGPLEDDELEEHRQAVIVVASRYQGISSLEARLSLIEGWATAGARRRSRYLSFLSLLRFIQQRFEECADLTARAAASRPPGPARAMPLQRQADALVQLGRLAEAEVALRQSLRLARLARWARGTCDASCSLRDLQSRLGRTLRPRRALVRAAEGVGPMQAALTALYEATFAWRFGALALAAELARFALDRFRPAGLHAVAMAAEALELVCQAPVPLERAAPVVAVVIQRHPYPLEALQLLGLLRRAVADPPPAWREKILELAQAIPPERWSQRLEIMSVDEALA